MKSLNQPRFAGDEPWVVEVALGHEDDPDFRRETLACFAPTRRGALVIAHRIMGVSHRTHLVRSRAYKDRSDHCALAPKVRK